MLQEYQSQLGAESGTEKNILGAILGAARDLADSARESDFARLVADIVMGRQAEDAFKTFYYWHALKGRVLPMPRERLLVIVAADETKAELQEFRNFVDGGADRLAKRHEDGFFARRENGSGLFAAGVAPSWLWVRNTYMGAAWPTVPTFSRLKDWPTARSCIRCRRPSARITLCSAASARPA